jgi:hypothetical protein
MPGWPPALYWFADLRLRVPAEGPAMAGKKGAIEPRRFRNASRRARPAAAGREKAVHGAVPRDAPVEARGKGRVLLASAGAAA